MSNDKMVGGGTLESRNVFGCGGARKLCHVTQALTGQDWGKLKEGKDTSKKKKKKKQLPGSQVNRKGERGQHTSDLDA